MNRKHHHEDHDGDDLHDRGLQVDVQTLMHRRHALKLFAGAAAIALVGCSDDSSSSSTAVATNTNAAPSGSTPTSGATSAASVAATIAATAAATATVVAAIPTSETPLSSCTVIPSETGGPYPGDGTNGPNVLIESGVVRSDIRASFGGSNGVAEGIPLTMKLTIVDTKNSCTAMEGAAVYAWHCDREGRYSLYSQGATDENYCRGVQAADASGVVTFLSIFPAAYSGRWPHVHFEIYPSLDAATSSANKLITSQLALPDEICQAVFATPGYEQSVTNHARTSLANDGVFRDGVELQMATVTGSVESGYVATLVIGV